MKAIVHRPDGTTIQFEGTPEEYRAAFEFVWPTLPLVPSPIQPPIYQPHPMLPTIICGPGQVLPDICCSMVGSLTLSGKDSSNITATH